MSIGTSVQKPKQFNPMLTAFASKMVGEVKEMSAENKFDKRKVVEIK